ncbi:P-loop ATPase, Sll1717 family [Paludibaculum fermentans]|uniref:P-loop ATPase, Sll1717 family n=1 Tax=Paludibaculum fermentans TaxID=1473598 RepID=UPI003EBFA0B5
MNSKFRFRQHDNIGVADAEQDQDFLRKCFVDNGEVAILSNPRDPRRIALGRTGAGKTALLLHFSENTSRVIEIKPESLALAYISNSTILQFVNQLGVNLNIFFKLLWRHVFTVEILKAHFHLESERATLNLIDRLTSLFSGKNQRHAQALNYLQKWGSTFWEETDYRIKELTTKLESDLKASIGGSSIPLPISVSAGGSLSEEQKREVVHRAQHVVNDVQIRQLSDMIELIDEVLDDCERPYFVVIDRLDEDWVEDKLRILLIRALIETIREFGKVRHAKIIIALRYDLLDRVIRLTRDAGFQEEKYESLYLNLEWTSSSLTALLDARIDKLVRSRYTTATVTHRDLLPTHINKCSSIDYIVQRTLMRPRDIILFFNLCIAQAKDTPKITVQMVRQAEGEYSRLRLRSLADEWQSTFATLLSFAAILKNSPPQFPLEYLTDEKCIELCLRMAEEELGSVDELSSAARRYIDGSISCAEFRQCLAAVLYRVGLVGLKLEHYEAPSWSITSRRSVSISEIRPNTRIAVHPCFWRALGIQEAVRL